jgi:two-component system, OmpR family, sensor kinase
MRKRLRVVATFIRQIFRSVRFRLTVWSVVLLGLVLFAFSAFVYTTQERNLRTNTILSLNGRMHQITDFYRIALLNYFTNGEMHFPEAFTQSSILLQDNETIGLINSQGQVIQKLGTISDNEINSLSQSFVNNNVDKLSNTYYQMDIGGIGAKPGHPYLFVLTPIGMPGDDNGSGLLLFGTPFDPHGILNNLLLTLIIASSAILLATLAGGYWLAGRVMQPVQIITRAAREISETDLRKRLNMTTKDELGELANTFDSMLDRLQAAFERQRQFTADASHELRTPLTIVNLEATRALERRRSSEDYVQSMAIIKSENEYMTQLVNDLLTLARMDAGQATVRTEELDLSDVTLDVVERLAPLAHQQGIQLSTGDLPEISMIGDRQLLSQMISNLVENAIKYASGNDIKVHIETGIRQNGKGQVGWVTVADNGPGIPAEHIPHLFDRFYRVDQARAQNQSFNDHGDQENGPSGSGLGLSIVKWIASAHSGDVSVSSELGKGSTFEVKLPMND